MSRAIIFNFHHEGSVYRVQQVGECKFLVLSVYPSCKNCEDSIFDAISVFNALKDKRSQRDLFLND